MKYILRRLNAALLRILSFLPLSFLYFLSGIFKFLLYRVIKYRRETVQSNLKSAFPEKSEEEILQIEKKFYSYLCDLIIESVKAFSITKSELLKRISYEDTSIYDRLYAEQKSAVVVMGHCGNWEWVCRSSPLFLKNKLIVAYKTLTDPVMDDAMKKMRTYFGAETVPMHQILRKVKSIKEPFLLVLVADQSPSDPQNSHWVQFLNRETAFMNGPAKLAQKLGLPLLFNYVYSSKRGQYTCTSKVLVEDTSTLNSEELSCQHVRFLEEMIRKNPENWLWSHKRWKHSKK